jgi:ABC-type antimicrobial peptide transport system permease subunit
VNPSDPVALTAATAILTVVTVLGAYIPARRAARVDPVQAFRAD